MTRGTGRLETEWSASPPALAGHAKSRPEAGLGRTTDWGG